MKHFRKSANQNATSFFEQIPNFPKYYVDYRGNIYSRCNEEFKKLKSALGANGYLFVNLVNEAGRKKRYVHQLVLETFVGPRPAGMLACHTPDPTKQNNRADNLRWQSPLENAADNLKDGTTGDRRNKLQAHQVREIRRLSATGLSNAEVARRMKVGPDTIRMIKNRETWAWLDDVESDASSNILTRT